MKGYYHEGPSLWNIAFIVIALGIFTWINITMGTISISVTGEPEIRYLKGELYDCQEDLKSKCEPCPECVCQTKPYSDFFLIFFGGIIGFLYFLFFGENLKQWLLRRWTPEDQKKEKKK